jgi:hypothetical protein
MSRPSGTHCLKEAEVFLVGTSAFNTWKFHAEQTKDPILAYAVKITGIENGKIMGNLYELDYQEHSLHANDCLKTETADVALRMGILFSATGKTLSWPCRLDYKQSLPVTFQPRILDADFLVDAEEQDHEKMPKGDLDKHLAGT